MQVDYPKVAEGWASRLVALGLRLRFGSSPTTKNSQPHSDKVMVYTSHMGGHRHLYAARFANLLQSLGLEVHVVYCGEQDPQSLQWLLHDAKDATWKGFKSTSLNDLKNLERVKLVDIRQQLTEARSELELITNYQRDNDITATFFVDADAMLKTILAQGVNRNPTFVGKSFGVFIRYDYLYRPKLAEQRFRDINERRHWVRSIIYEKFLVQRGYLDGILPSDDMYAEKHAKTERVSLIEEIGHYESEETLSDGERALYKRLEGRYRQWKGRHKDKEIVLMFGDLEVRKGFDFLLRLVAEREDLILVRLGRMKPGYKVLNWPEVRAREKLLEEDRLLEFSTYCGSQKFIDKLFKDAHHIPLAYRNHARTSGVWRQVLSFGKPVIFPSYGVCGFRTQHNDVGVTYDPDSYSSFVEAFDRLNTSYNDYCARAERYFAERLSNEALLSTLKSCLEKTPGR